MKEMDIFEEIIDLGKRQGVLSYNDINNAFPSEFISEDELENILNLLHDMGIEVIDNQEDVVEEEEVLEEQEKYEKTEDLVQTYFQSMGDIPVLSKYEEKKVARRMEEGNDIIKQIITGLPLYQELLKELDRKAQEDPPHNLEEKTDEAIRESLKFLDGIFQDFKSSIQRNGKKDINLLKFHHIAKEVPDVYRDELKEKYERITKARKLISEAKDELITHNLRLVVNIAKRYIGRGLPLLDLIQEGNMGMMKAIDKFDYKRGFKFSTYATWWIRQAISRALIDQTKTIRLPVHVVEFHNKVYNASKELAQRLGREPLTEEIAQTLQVSARKVEGVLKAMQDPITLQTPVGDEDTTLEDFISDNGSSPYIDTERNKITGQIIAVLRTLTPKEEGVLRMRFGIGVDRDYTLEEVGSQFSITRERVRQIEAKAISKLKHPKRLRALKYLNTS